MSNPYTAGDHIADMAAAGAPFEVQASGVYQPFADVDLDAFTAARAKAEAAGITTRDVYEALQSGPDQRDDFETYKIIAAFHDLPPMKRLFARQQLTDMALGNKSAFDGSMSAAELMEIYEEWLSAFDPSVVEAFESGKWKVGI